VKFYRTRVGLAGASCRDVGAYTGLTSIAAPLRGGCS